MTALNRQALLRAAVKIGAEKWTHDGNGEVTTEEYTVDGQALVDLICNCEVVGTSSPRAEFIALANPAAILVLLNELEAAEKRIADQHGIILSARNFISEYAVNGDVGAAEFVKILDRAAGISVKGE